MFHSKTEVHWLSCRNLRQDLEFAMDITEEDLKLKLQGKNKLITQLYVDVKLSLLKSQLLNEIFVHFHACKEQRRC